MASPNATVKPSLSEAPLSSAATLIPIGIALLVALGHILTNGRYGFHRDELQTLSDALHLDWGFVAYPPFTPFVERIGLAIFGISLIGLRLFSEVLAGPRLQRLSQSRSRRCRFSKELNFNTRPLIICGGC